MSVSSESLDPIARTQMLREELHRVMGSATLRSSEVLRKLLSYLAASALEDQAELVKAKDIATAVFNRSEDFDSQSDSVVRVQIGRLRAKLAEHYIDEAPETEWVLTIPKGSYQLCCHPRRHVGLALERKEELKTISPLFAPADLSPAEAPSQAGKKYPKLIVPALAAAALCVGAFWAGRMMPTQESRSSGGPAVTKFWRPFGAGADVPLIVFSNQKLVGSVNGLHAYRGTEADRNVPLIESWSTVGEVIGVFDVTKTLALFRKTPVVKPAHLLTWDDAKNGDLIVVGGPLSETADVNLFPNFQFATNNKNPAIPTETGAIVNLRPGKGEAPIYLGPAARPFDFDYALISLRPSLSDGHQMLAMAGITEYGTEAAADFLTQESTLEKLIDKLGATRSRRLPWFEALLRVQVQDGVPLQSTIIILRREPN